MERASRATWAKRVERWKASGLSAAEYAAEVGVSPKALSWWKWQLGRSSEPKRAKPRGRTSGMPTLTFVEMAAPARSEPFEVVLPSGVLVRVPMGFDAATLERLIAVLGKK